MPRVTFTEDASLTNAAGQVVESYLAGATHDLSADRCRRWIKRGKAVYAAEVAEKAAVPFVPYTTTVITNPVEGVVTLQENEAGDFKVVSGPSPDSGEAKPSSASPADQASPEPTAISSEASGESQSTSHGNTPPTPISSTERTRRGGGPRQKRGKRRG